MVQTFNFVVIIFKLSITSIEKTNACILKVSPFPLSLPQDTYQIY